MGFIATADRWVEELPFRRRPNMLFLDSRECLLVLCRDSLVEAPASPAVVDSIFWDDERDGAFKWLRLLVELVLSVG